MLSISMMDLMALLRGLREESPGGFVDPVRELLARRLEGMDLVLGGTDLDCWGLSEAHASQQRKFGGFERVQMGHDQPSGVSSFIAKSTLASSTCISGGGGFETGLVASGMGGGETDDRGPAGFS